MAGRRNRSRGCGRPAVVLARSSAYLSLYLRGQRRECTGFTGTGYTNLVEIRIAPKV